MLGFSVVHQQVFHLIEIGGSAVASPLEIPGGILQKPFGRFLRELEFPVQVVPLPAPLLQVGHHGLAEAVDRDLVDPLRHPFAPVGAVGVEVALHLFPGHRVATVVAVADLVRAFQDRESHCGGRCTRNLDVATGVGGQAVLQENSVLRG